jgi:hypothetical protein
MRWLLPILALLALAGCGTTFTCVSGDPSYNAAEKTLKVTCDGKTCATVRWTIPPVFTFVCPVGQKAVLEAGQPACVKE